jgi:hypothetical protein
VDVPVASWECARCCIIGILIDHWPKHHAVGHLLPPDFQTPLQRADETVWIEPGIFRLQTFKELPAVRSGSASNQPRSCAVTVNNGSERRRKRFARAFGRAVGRTSLAFHAIRRPTRNWSRVGALTSVASPCIVESAISTRSFCAARISLSRRTGSRPVRIASTRRRTCYGVPASIKRRWHGVAGE